MREINENLLRGIFNQRYYELFVKGGWTLSDDLRTMTKTIGNDAVRLSCGTYTDLISDIGYTAAERPDAAGELYRLAEDATAMRRSDLRAAGVSTNPEQLRSSAEAYAADVQKRYDADVICVIATEGEYHVLCGDGDALREIDKDVPSGGEQETCVSGANTPEHAAECTLDDFWQMMPVSTIAVCTVYSKAVWDVIAQRYGGFSEIALRK